MCEYKVFKWRFDMSSSEELEETLNNYAKEGFKVLNIVPNVKGSGGIVFASVNANEATIILEKNK